MTKKIEDLKTQTLNHYKRHADLYGPEGLLEVAVDELPQSECSALEHYLSKHGSHISTESVDTLAQRIAGYRRDCEVLNVRILRARADHDSTSEVKFVYERDAIRRAQEKAEERLAIRLAVTKGSRRSKKGTRRGVNTRAKRDQEYKPTIKPKDLAPDQTYNQLTVVAIDKCSTNASRWKVGVLCDCGRTKTVLASNLVRGLTQSCGCHRSKTTKRMVAKQMQARHG